MLVSAMGAGVYADNVNRDIVITPGNTGGVIFNANNQNGFAKGEVTEDSFDGKSVFKLSWERGTTDTLVYASALNLSNLNFKTDDYSYLKIRLYYVETAGNSAKNQTPRINYVVAGGKGQWHVDNNETKPVPMRPDGQTVGDYFGKWCTLIIPLDKTTYSGKTITELEILPLDYTQADGIIYIQSIIISDDAEDATVDKNVISFVGMQRNAENENKVRFISVLKTDINRLENYSDVGYVISAEYKGVKTVWDPFADNIVYTNLWADGVELVPSDYGGTYFVVLNFSDIPDIDPLYNINFTVRPFITEKSGTKIYAVASSVALGRKECETVSEAYTAALDGKAQTMRNAVLNNDPSADYISWAEENAKTVRYVSENGNDSYDGLTQQTAIKTLARADQLKNETDVFLFECGSTFRGRIWAEDGRIYSHYGDVSKGLPIINGSLKNYASSSL